jgi:hypothetical protein
MLISALLRLNPCTLRRNYSPARRRRSQPAWRWRPLSLLCRVPAGQLVVSAPCPPKHQSCGSMAILDFCSKPFAVNQNSGYPGLSLLFLFSATSKERGNCWTFYPLRAEKIICIRTYARFEGWGNETVRPTVLPPTVSPSSTINGNPADPNKFCAIVRSVFSKPLVQYCLGSARVLNQHDCLFVWCTSMEINIII